MEAVIPPHSTQSEELVIGAALLHPRTFTEASGVISGDDVYHPALRAIFEGMASLARDSKPIDAVTVEQEMRSLGTWDTLNSSGGASYLSELATNCPTVEGVSHHARVIRSKADRRRAAMQLHRLQGLAFGKESDADFFAALDEATMAFAQGRRSDGGLLPFRGALREAVTNLGERIANKGAIHGVPWGLRRLDEILCGSRAGELVVVGARPGMGKTALLLQVLIHAAKQGHPAAKFSLEMLRAAIGERALASYCGVDSRDLKTGMIKDVDWLKMNREASDLAELPIVIADRSRQIGGIRSEALRWRAGLKTKKTPIVGIDYAQLVEPSESTKKKRNREQEVAEISRMAKQIAEDIEGVVVLLAQLSRACESRQDKRPTLADLRESGGLEQDADAVVFIYRDEYYLKDKCPDEDKGIAEIIVAKQRNGMTGTVRVGFQGQYTRFVNLAESDREEQAPPLDFRGRGRGTYHEPDRERE